MPLVLANLSAKFFQLLPNPLLTEDQLRLLKYDNVTSGKYKTNKEIGLPSKLFFKDEVKKYSFMWRDGGQFSTDKYNVNDSTFHYIMWYTCDKSDLIPKEINRDIHRSIYNILRTNNFKYVYYENPKMSVPDMYHIHVFFVKL